jgi:2-C-methyl-D-erythritol 4-phosphate cytidylyltransferase
LARLEGVMPPRTRRAYAVLLGAVAGLDEELASEVSLLQALGTVDEIHVWAFGQDAEAIRALVSTNSWEKVAAVNAARPTRDATIFDALTVISRTAGDEDLVLIADAGQPSLTEPAVSSCLSVAAEQGAAMLASRVTGDVVHVDGSGRITWLPPTDSTLVAAGLLVAQFSRLFDLYDWASTVAAGAIQAPYRWSLARLGAFVVVS